MRTTGVVASRAHKDIYINEDTFQAQEAEGEDLNCQSFYRSQTFVDVLTSKNRRFEQLHKFIDLNEHIHSHLKLRTEFVSSRLRYICLPLTRSEADCMLAHKLVQVNIARTLRRHCSTKT